MKIAPDLDLHCREDDFTDPWTTPEVVVLLHGNAESGEAWRAWVPHLARRFRVIRPDQRGFGQSTPMPRDFPWTIDVLTTDLARFAEALGLARFHLVAAKFGGTVALRFAAEHPALVQTLTVLGTPPAPRRTLAAGIPAWVEHLERHGVESWARWTMEGRLGSAMPPAAVDWWARLMGRTSLDTQLGFMRMVPGVDVTADLERIQCPTLVITTEKSGMGTVEDFAAWQRRIPRSELVALPGDSYHVAASDPDRCATTVLEFIRRQTAPRRV